MNTRQLAKIIIMGTLLASPICRVIRAAYLEEKADTGREFVPPRPLPPPPADNPLSRLIQRVEIGRPHDEGGLTLFPLLLPNTGNPPDIRTLDEALSHDWITIREQDHARVSELVVRNESKHPVFMMAGEILGGGRQDRIIRNDVLLPPGSETLPVPVYCGEQNRWKGDKESFDSSPCLAGQAVRSMATRAESQDAIWREIDSQLKQSGVSAPTRSYQSLFSDLTTRNLTPCLGENEI